jgi:PAS domain S-box-containing protein
MDALLKFLSGHDNVPGSTADIYWSILTIALSFGVAVGYAAIGYNRYFHSKLARTAQCASASRRLLIITLASIICGGTFFWYDMPWPIWRIYDFVLLLLLYSTWSYAIRMRGLSLVDERLSQVMALEESAKRYSEIAEYLPQMVWTARESGNIDFCNHRWLEYVGDGRTWLDALHPDDRSRVEAWWARTLRARKAATIEARLSGVQNYHTFVISATPIITDGIVKWLGACADIETQKATAASRELHAKRRAFFLNALSHDLRAPLNTVVLNAEMLKVVPPDEVRNCVVNIMESAKSAGDYVTKILDLARAGGEEQNRIEYVSVAGILSNIHQRFVPIAEQKGLYLQLFRKNDIEVQTDRQKLERLIGNLLDNALKSTSHGGVVLELLPARDGFAVRVTDTGIGIPADTAPYLFDEFYQVNNTERDRSKGFGMGLTICKYLAQQLGGNVRLLSTGEQGSCFEVTMPAQSPTDTGAAVDQPLAASPL